MSEQLSQTPLTDQQRRALGSRVIHDAELIKGGAGYDAYGHFEVTREQAARLHEQSRQEAARKAFAETPEHNAIRGHQERLSSIRDAVGINHGIAVMIQGLNTPVSGELPLDREDETAYLRSNGIDVDLRAIAPEAYNEASDAVSAIEQAEQRLRRLQEIMTDRTDIRIGSEVAVPRPPDARHQFHWRQEGWRIRGISANGELFVGLPPQDDSNPVGDVAADVIGIDIALAGVPYRPNHRE